MGTQPFVNFQLILKWQNSKKSGSIDRGLWCSLVLRQQDFDKKVIQQVFKNTYLKSQFWRLPTILILRFLLLFSCILHSSYMQDTSPNEYNTWNQRRFDVESKILMNFHIVSTNFFDVILMGEKRKSFWRTFFGVISMGEKSTLFWRTFVNVIYMGEKSTSFRHTFFNVFRWAKSRLHFDVISVDEISTQFRRSLFDIISMHEKSCHFDACTFFGVILMDEKLTSFWCTFWYNFDGLKIDTTLTCLFWCVLDKQMLVVLISLFDKFLF